MTTSILDIAVDVDFPPACYLNLGGELDLSGTDDVASAVDEALAMGMQYVLIDLFRLTFIDMAGAGMLLRCRAASAASGSGFLVTGARGFVRRVLDVSDVWPVLSRPHLPKGAFASSGVLPVPVPRPSVVVSRP
ncbi:STAS domain-containing protein [Actinoplanes missouriensis]|uniref:STAS domain-containing protein n=1 Tax=Actinoplanes missouriensis TaxID=1866 RepID=UPI0033D2DCDB